MRELFLGATRLVADDLKFTLPLPVMLNQDVDFLDPINQSATSHTLPILTTVASGNAPFLRKLPLKRLQAFTKAFGLNTASAIEKEDFVQIILKAKDSRTGGMGMEAMARQTLCGL